jgi:hypothetical protein
MRRVATAPWLADPALQGHVRRNGRQKYAAKLSKRALLLRGRVLAGEAGEWDKPQDFVVGAHALPTVLSDEARWARVNDPLQAMMQVDIEGYLTDDILKVDRASMAVPLMLVEPADVPGLAHALASWRAGGRADARGRRSHGPELRRRSR